MSAAGAAVVLAALSTGAFVLVVSTADPGSRRVAALGLRPRPAPRTAGAAPVGRRRTQTRASLAAIMCGLAVLSLTGGRVGLALAVVAGALASTLLNRLEPRAVVAAREQVARDLPLAVHLLAATSMAGATPSGSIDMVGRVLGGPVGNELRRVAAVARLGGDLSAAWGSIGPDSDLAPLARTVSRAVESGAPLALSLDRLATDLRSQRRFEVDRRARSVGVRAAAPLGLCFLPAFLLIGVVPIVIGIAAGVLDTVL